MHSGCKQKYLWKIRVPRYTSFTDEPVATEESTCNIITTPNIIVTAATPPPVTAPTPPPVKAPPPPPPDPCSGQRGAMLNRDIVLDAGGWVNIRCEGGANLGCITIHKVRAACDLGDNIPSHKAIVSMVIQI